MSSIPGGFAWLGIVDILGWMIPTSDQQVERVGGLVDFDVVDAFAICIAIRS